MRWNFHHTVPDTSELYTRAIVDELCPGPMSPMTATAGVGGHLNAAWASLYIRAGLHPEAQNSDLSPATAIFGGRLYLNTTLLRRFAALGIGADPVAFTRQYVGERSDAPRSRAIRSLPHFDPDRWTAWLARTSREPELHGNGRTSRMHARGPALVDMSTTQLARHIEMVSGLLGSALQSYVEAQVAVGASMYAVARIAEGAGHPVEANALLGGPGTAESSAMAAVWTLSRTISGNPRMHALLTDHASRLTGCLDGGSSDSIRLRSAINSVRLGQGHMGPAEWELSGETWTTHPRLLLRLVDHLCRTGQAADPTLRVATGVEHSASLGHAIRRSLRDTPGPNAVTRAAADRPNGSV